MVTFDHILGIVNTAILVCVPLVWQAYRKQIHRMGDFDVRLAKKSGELHALDRVVSEVVIKGGRMETVLNDVQRAIAVVESRHDDIHTRLERMDKKLDRLLEGRTGRPS